MQTMHRSGRWAAVVWLLWCGRSGLVPEARQYGRTMFDAFAPASVVPPIGLDRQGWITVVAGLLIALITLFTSYTHVDLPGLGAIPIDQQIGVPLLLASLATP